MESTITPQLATSSSEGIAETQILTLTYWFGTPESASLNHLSLAFFAALSTIVLIAVLALVGVKMLNSNLSPVKQKFLSKACWSLAAFGPIGWLLVASRSFGVVFFSARFWWVIWAAALLATLVWLFREYKKIPEQQVQYQTYQLKKRYFPKKKKK